MDIIDKLTEFTQKEARGVSACTTVADIRRLVDAAGEDNALLQLGGRGDVLLLTLAIVSLTHNLQPPVLLHMMSLAQLLVGVTPVQETDLPARHQRILRAGIGAVAVLATLVSLYALSAIVYRTVQGGFTINRVTVIGWNTINVGLLVLLVIRQIRAGADRWVDAAQRVFGWGMRAYAVWTTFLLLAIPLLFREG